MKKVSLYIAAAAMLTACSNDIDYTDSGYKNEDIQFAIARIAAPVAEGTSGAATRAGEHGHSAWDAAKHANTLGVFGYGDRLTKVFDNQKAVNNAGKWEYTPVKYWGEYASCSSFDFFGYMVEADGLPAAYLYAMNNNTRFRLSFPASIEKPFIESADNTPLICHAPTHMESMGDAVPFQMDQTLVGYNVQFQLGEKMDYIRYFVIKSVKLYGDNLPISGNVERIFTYSGGAWTTGDVEWTSVSTTSIPESNPFVLCEAWQEQPESKRTVNTHSDWVKWGDESSIEKGAFYVIPYASFNPTIEVTYDVYADKDFNNDGTQITRKDVKSKIILNTRNFKELASVMTTTGEIHPIKIKIVPSYLYVLSDDDMKTTGYLVAE